MTKITDQRLWVAVHLLYPNSSQALDVYHTILGSIAQKNKDTYAQIIFLKLQNFFYNNVAVRSGQPFRVFENQKLESWEILYQKSPKQHLLVILGLIVFNFNIKDVSALLKISDQKARFFVNQTFRKIIQFKMQKPETETEFKFKRIDDKSVSYFFTTENLVEFSLNMLSAKDNTLVQNGLLLHPQLKDLQQKYSEIIQELSHLIKIPVGPFQSSSVDQFQSYKEPKKDVNTKLKKSSLAAFTISAVFIGIVILRPFSFKNFPLNFGSRSIKMIEVNSQPYLTAKETDLDKTTSAVNLAEMPVTDKLKGPVKNKKDEAKTDKVLAVASRKIETPQPPKNLEASKQGGLFRASIQVSDLDTLGVRITDKLVALGGTKAGEVELGWKKSPKVLYYHLVLPAENIDQMQEFLNKFGQLNIQFENHPRLMPIGFKRIILEVKEGE